MTCPSYKSNIQQGLGSEPRTAKMDAWYLEGQSRKKLEHISCNPSLFPTRRLRPGETTGKPLSLLWLHFLSLADEKQTPSCQGFRTLSLFVGTAVRSKQKISQPCAEKHRSTGRWVRSLATQPGSPWFVPAQPALHSLCHALSTTYTPLEVPPWEALLLLDPTASTSHQVLPPGWREYVLC